MNRRIAGRRRQDAPATDLEAPDELNAEGKLLLELHESATKLRRFGRFYEVVATVGAVILVVGFVLADIAVITVAATDHDTATAVVGLAAIPIGLFFIYATYVASAMIGTFVRAYAVARLLEVERF